MKLGGWVWFAAEEAFWAIVFADHTLIKEITDSYVTNKTIEEIMSLKALREFVQGAISQVNERGVLVLDQQNAVVNRSMTEAIVEALRSQSPNGIIAICHDPAKIDLFNKGATKRDDFDTLYTMLWVAQNPETAPQLQMDHSQASFVFKDAESYQRAKDMLLSPDNRHLFVPQENE